MPTRVVDKAELREQQAAAVQAGKNPKNVSYLLYRKRRYADDPVFRESVKQRSKDWRARKKAEAAVAEGPAVLQIAHNHG